MKETNNKQTELTSENKDGVSTGYNNVKRLASPPSILITLGSEDKEGLIAIMHNDTWRELLRQKFIEDINELIVEKEKDDTDDKTRELIEKAIESIYEMNVYQITTTKKEIIKTQISTTKEILKGVYNDKC